MGKPTALLLLRRNATVTLRHTKTTDLANHSKRADILVAAAGRAGLATKQMIKSGAAAVDVSTARVSGKQMGDLGPGVDEVAGRLTPNLAVAAE
jgi:methylenetetrahydrofolate dehydrogenase (NADP+)/methenyltetrahydrofolate cyclohydrolase